MGPKGSSRITKYVSVLKKIIDALLSKNNTSTYSVSKNSSDLKISQLLLDEFSFNFTHFCVF